LAIAHAELDETVRGKVAVSDVVQETLMRVQQKLPDFRGETENELLGWIRRILVNHIADVRKAYRQTDKRRIDREVRLNDDLDRSGIAMLQLAIDTATPGRAAVAGEELDRLKAAIAELSEEYRTVLSLRTWERLPFSDVGKRMNRSPDAARMLWSRAVQQLSSQLQTNEHETS
jgi:RNA polymerase sigma-70 factor (ECF subfamily)